MTVGEHDRRTIRMSFAGLTLLLIALLAAVLIVRLRDAAELGSHLNAALLYLAAPSALLAIYVGLRRKLAQLRGYLGWLTTALAATSGVSLLLVDYGEFGRSSRMVPVVLVVSIALAYLRHRS